MRLLRWLPLCLLPLATALGAHDLDAAAQREYRQCLKDTAAAAQACSFGGCCTIQASCYQRQRAVFDAAAERVAAGLRSGRCAASARRLDADVETLATRLSQLPELEASYSALELQVRLAAFRQWALQALAQECAVAPTAAPSPAER